MTPERWSEIEELFHRAMERAPERRGAWLDEACRHDPELRREVEALVSCDQAAGEHIRAAVSSQLNAIAFPLVGETVSHYRVWEGLGGGGMGVVYRAEDTRLGRRVALKFLPQELANDPVALERFEREARSASALEHPNICPIYEFGEHEGQPFLVMPLLEGKTLRELLSPPGSTERLLPLDQLLDLAVQIADGLDAAHHQGIVHRDIKPANIFVTTQGQVKILDFGLAKLQESDTADLSVRPTEDHSPRPERDPSLTLTGTGLMIGTVGYMSPEQIRDEKLDARTDLFSFGMVLYEMAAGKPAFTGETAAAIQNGILTQTPTPVREVNPKIPRKLERIITKALEKDRGSRYHIATEMRADLAHVGQSLFLARRGRPGRLTLRREPMLASGVVIVIAVIASILYFRGYKNDWPAEDLKSASEPIVLPLLSLPGEERMPAFSPDGSRVAFLWRPPEHNKSGIYVVAVGGRSLLRLTQNAEDYSPAWSPDGRTVAFLRDSGDKFFIELAPAQGGPERKIYTGPIGPFGQLEGISFSRNGRWLAFAEWNAAAEPDSIKLLSLDGSSKRFLTVPPLGFHDRRPAFSPSDDRVAFVRSSGPIYVDELFVVPVSGGEPKQLTFDHTRIFGPPAWTQDGREIIYASNRAGLASLWRIAASGGSPQRVPSAGPVAWYPSAAPAGRQLAYEQNDDEQDLWRLELRDPTHARGSAALLTSSANAGNYLPQFSPDGRKIAFTSDRSGYSEVWICDANGSNLLQVTSFQPLAGSPRWSPDGRFLAFDNRPGRHSEIYVVELAGGRSHPVAAFPDADSVVPSWSRDGRWIYFASNRGGKFFQIWKVAIKDGAAVHTAPLQITRNGGFAAVESSDGKHLIYSKQSDPGLWSAPRDGGREECLWPGPGPDNWANWALAKEGVYFLTPNAASPPEIEFLDFSSGRTSPVASIKRSSFYGLALSPDGRSLIYSQRDRDAHQILIMQNFR